MREYHKINGLYKRFTEGPMKGQFKDGRDGNLPEFAQDEFRYLYENPWRGTEKIDGCLGPRERIQTEEGPIEVRTLVNNKLPVRVLSYNTELNKIEYRSIIYYHKEERLRPFLRVSVRSRNKGNRPKSIVCTDNHKFYTNTGWVQSKDLVAGQKVYQSHNVLSEELKQVILGSLLGDSSIYRPASESRGFSFNHSIAQEEYFQWKNELLGPLFSQGKGSVGGFPGSKPTIRGSSRILPALSELIMNTCEEGNKKTVTPQWAEQLSPIGIAIWYMDDGSSVFTNVQRPRARFATNGFSWEENELLCASLNRFGLEAKTYQSETSKGCYISLGANGSEKLYSLIFPFVPECMKYKLPMEYRDFPTSLVGTLYVKEGLLETEVLSVETVENGDYRDSKHQYDISVEGNSNYFTNNILVHNTNIRIHYTPNSVAFAGRTDKAQIPTFLESYLLELCEQQTPFAEVFGDTEVTLYGEGYGARIQKGGGKYIPGDVGFILFDVRIGNFWLKREDVRSVAEQLGIKTVPVIFEGTLAEAEAYVRKGFQSVVAEEEREAEGLVLTPIGDFLARNGNRIITKLKVKDYREG